MKNHIVFKFIAVILCAASLMGAVGSILGVVAMAEGDLYNKTVDQVIDERVSDNCTHYATELALAYASLDLGGCSEDMIRQQFENNWWFENSYPSYGYTILDAEGATLAEYNTGLKDSATFYSVPVTGKYMYLVSVESQSELQAQQEQPLKASDLDCYFHPDFYEERCADVYQMSATLADGSGVGYNGGNVPLGSITYYADHYVVFETTTARGYDNSMMTLPVTSIVFSDQDGSTVFSISCSDGVGDFAVTDSGSIVFTSVTFEEAMSAGSSRFVGQLTGADGEVVPPEGMSVSQVTFTDADGQVIYEAYCDYLNCDSTYYDTNGDCASYSNVSSQTGFLFYSQSGQLVYNSSLMEGEDPFTATVYGVDFYNDSQVLRCKLDDPDGLGTLTLKDGRLVFTSFLPAETTAAETVPETVPETEPETVPETVETVAEEAVGEAEDTPDDSSDETSAEEAAEETAAAETAAAEETVPSSASAVPEETSTVSEDPTAPEASAAPEAPTEPTAAETVPVTVPQETLPEVTEPVLIDGKTLDNYQINRVQYQDSETGETMTAKYVYVTMPELTVEMYVDRSTMQDAASYDVLRMVRAYRNYLMPAIGICLLLFAVFAVYLCTSAGRSAKSEEIKAGGLNRLPLDLYLFGGGFGIACIIAVGVQLAQRLLRQDFMAGCCIAVGAAFLACLVFVGFCFAFVAQIKTPGGFWWRNSLCGLCIRWCIRFGRWLETALATKGFPFLVRVCKSAWKNGRKFAEDAYHFLKRIFTRCSRWIGGKFQAFFSLLPMTWQWLLGGFAMFLLIVIAFNTYSGFLQMLCLAACVVIVLYAAHCFGTLLESTKRMGRGDLDTKVEDKLLKGSFKEFADDLNDLAGVAVVAAQKQLKSERMKTELITNVSHDIKTPLTSIINYVDLLQKPHTDEEEQQYLEVLDRQSQRLKKLIDDLMDMSKASTGNMAVDITKVDAVESVNQALGEFADKLDKVQLYPVFRHDEESVAMMADGRLVWRVMSNLLSNAVKYAMPGTRLYIDLMQLEGKVVISLKNISRDELNVDADELMERFVRGDDSRNTEGSGLGLNIAKSLMELQKGQLQLLVDGDLFKVTLIFPGA